MTKEKPVRVSPKVIKLTKEEWQAVQARAREDGTNPNRVISWALRYSGVTSRIRVMGVQSNGKARETE